MKYVSEYDAANMTVRDFIEYVAHAASKVNANYEADLISDILTKLRGSAKEYTTGKVFPNLTDLIDLLKDRFAPGKPYESYLLQIVKLKMYHDESIKNFTMDCKILWAD